ncbi:MAG: glutamine--fructose-6-phosphate transaminase (isomerizing), partial [Lachnospiraceae bacterium]|nr:glutamine--fructose-6-phosphate transaminase (isomerizing) [Lachnospiraceae bacterium]
MCGIVGYIGKKQAGPVLLKGLSRLEYRGYDSAGLAVLSQETGNIDVVKAKGRLRELEEKTDNGKALPGISGIGHTRWATHGEPSITNAHPHATDDHHVVLVHNGVIENYQEIKGKLTRAGYAFHSQTDTEIIVKLVDYYFKKTGNPLEAISRTMLRMRGSFALGIMFKAYPDSVFAARKDSPLIAGKGEDGMYIASDVPAILEYTRNVAYLDNMEMAELTANDIHYYNIDREEIQKETVEISWDAEAAEKGGYEHFMLKEIFEQPEALRNCLRGRLLPEDGTAKLSGLRLGPRDIASLSNIVVTACGTSYYAGLHGVYAFEEFAGIPARIEQAAEFRYRNPIVTPDTALVSLSQSGETADTLAAVRDTLNAYLSGGKIKFADSGLEWKKLGAVSRFYLVGCGSAYHVCCCAK